MTMGSAIVLLHEFHDPPYGGGNQFLLALRAELERQGLPVEVGRAGPDTRAVLFNSHHVEPARLRRIARPGLRMVHRVDGPIGVYRGRDDGTDERIWSLNQEFADATIFQSQYSLDKHVELGLRFKEPHVIHNAADPAIFFPAAVHRTPEKLRVIASSWSDNPRKGGPVYQWLDERLDRDRYEFTFVGRIDRALRLTRTIEARPSAELASLLREQDIYLTASQDDPCSNALIEALSCGLPAVYRTSGGHPEVVRSGGLGFDRQEEIPALLDRIRADYDGFRARIQVPRIADVASDYLRVMGVA
jgi:glycosyltransferase involved in cell wall biosynthesis